MGIKNLTAEYLRQILHYNRDTGIFTWAVQRWPSQLKPGTRAGTLHLKGYIEIKLDGAGYKAHRLAWLYVTGSWPRDQIDHKNGCRADNRFNNLRECNNAQNCQNQKLRIDNSSGVQGVNWRKADKKWHARIMVNLKSIHLGFFTSLEEARTAYAKAKTKYHIDSPVFKKRN